MRRMPFLALRLSLLPVASQGPCVAGKSTPPRSGKSYADPNFGAVVRVLGRAPSVHGYSTPSPLSADNHYALISEWDTPMIVELASGRLVARVPFSIEGALWNAQD